MKCKVCGNTSVQNSSLSFFRFPKENSNFRSRDWAERCHLLDLFEKHGPVGFYKSFRICSRHFDPKHIVFDGRKNKLLKSAIPEMSLVAKNPSTQNNVNNSNFSLPQNLCRLCAKEGDNVIDIFGWRGRLLKLEIKLKYLPQVIKKHDILPLKICNWCVLKVNQFYDFIRNCTRAETKLRAMLNTKVCNPSTHSHPKPDHYSAREAALLQPPKIIFIPDAFPDIMEANSHHHPLKESVIPDCKAPDANQDTPDANQDTLDANQDTPDANQDTPDANQDTPDANQDTPDANQDTPEANQDTPDANQDTPEANQDTPEANQDTPDANQDTPDANQETPDFLKSVTSDHDYLGSQLLPTSMGGTKSRHVPQDGEVSSPRSPPKESFKELHDGVSCSRFEFKPASRPEEKKCVLTVCDKNPDASSHHHSSALRLAGDIRSSQSRPESKTKTPLKGFREQNFGESCESSERFSKKKVRPPHYKKHSEKPLQCIKCGRFFSSKATLRQHRSVHSDRRPYSCRECDKSFKRKDALQDHMRTHTNERPFLCTVCAFAFMRRGNCISHEKNHEKYDWRERNW